MNTLIIICLTIVLYWRARNLYYKRLTLEYRLKLYKLRDKLRCLAIDGKVNKNDWVFNYLDTSISKTISVMDNMNLFLLLILIIKYHKREDIAQFSKNVEDEVVKNAFLYDAFAEYGKLIVEFLMKKHYWITIIVSTIGKSIKAITSTKKQFEFFASSIRVYPETSTSDMYA